MRYFFIMLLALSASWSAPAAAFAGQPTTASDAAINASRVTVASKSVNANDKLAGP
jgi:hypothetical protein